MEDKIKEIIKKEIKNELKFKYDNDFETNSHVIIRDLLRKFGKKEEILLDAIIEFYTQDFHSEDNSFVKELIEAKYNPKLIIKYIKNGNLKISSITTAFKLYSLTKDNDFLMFIIDVVGDDYLPLLITAGSKDKKLLKNEGFFNLLSKSISSIYNAEQLANILEHLHKNRVKYNKIPQPIVDLLKDYINKNLEYYQQAYVWYYNREYIELFDSIKNKQFRPLTLVRYEHIMVKDTVSGLFGYVDNKGIITIPTIFDEIGISSFKGDKLVVMGLITKKREDMDIGVYVIDLKNGELIDYTNQH